MFLFSLPVFISAGAGNSVVSAADPKVDVRRVNVLNPLDGCQWISRLLVDANGMAGHLSTEMTPIYISLYGLRCRHHAQTSK